MRTPVQLTMFQVLLTSFETCGPALWSQPFRVCNVILPESGHSSLPTGSSHACQCVIGNIPNLNWDVSCFIVLSRWRWNITLDRPLFCRLFGSLRACACVGHCRWHLCGDWVRFGGLHLNSARYQLFSVFRLLLDLFVAALSSPITISTCASQLWQWLWKAKKNPHISSSIDVK